MAQEPAVYGRLRRKKPAGKSTSQKSKARAERFKKEDFKPKTEFTYTCAYCGKSFTTHRVNAKCCTRVHTNALYYKTHQDKWGK